MKDDIGEYARYRDDAYWDPFAQCWVEVTKPVIVDPSNPPLTDPNVLYGDRYGVDWVYPTQEPQPACSATHSGSCSNDLNKPSWRIVNGDEVEYACDGHLASVVHFDGSENVVTIIDPSVYFGGYGQDQP